MVTFPLFEGYTSRGAQTLLDRGRIRQCQAGEVLYHGGQPAEAVLLVLGGEVEHFLTRGAREVRLGWAGPSHVLADVQVMGHLPHPASARVRDGATVLEWDRAAFDRLIGADSVFARRVMQQTALSLAAQAEVLVASLAAMQPE
jgi:CRP-like cAMP-binding protein